MGGNEIQSSFVPSSGSDLVNLLYSNANYLASNSTLNSISIANPTSANVDLHAFKIINLATPTLTADAATKAYVDSVAGSATVS